MATDDLKKNSNAYTIHVFNTETLDLVYKQSYKNNENKFFSFKDLAITDEAIVFSVGKLYKSGKREKDKSGTSNYDFIVYKISKQNTENTLIKLDNTHIRSLVINQKLKDLQLVGFYSEKNTNRVKGGCSFNLDPETLELMSKKSFELPEQVYSDLYNNKAAKRKKDKGKELSSFYVDYIVEDSKNNIYLIAEEFFITQVYIANGLNGGYWQTVFHYNDILILKFNPNGDLDWGRSIFKKANGPSYNVFLKDEQLHVILNSGKNLIEKKDGRTKVSKGILESSSLYDIVFTKNGEVSYDKIQDNKGKTSYTPYYGTYNNGEFIMMSDRRKKKQFMILQ